MPRSDSAASLGMSILVAVLVIGCLEHQVVVAQTLCPACYNNQTPLPGHGTAPDGSGRRILYISVDTASWGSPPPSSITQGVQNAVNNWNKVSTCYYFQVITSGTPDFSVRSGTPSGGCADNQIASYPYVITLATSIQRQNATLVGTLLTHEIGHGIGLDNADNGCADGGSIMEGQDPAYTNCNLITRSIQPIDVQKSNQNCTSKATCERSRPTDVGVPVVYSCPIAPSKLSL